MAADSSRAVSNNVSIRLPLHPSLILPTTTSLHVLPYAATDTVRSSEQDNRSEDLLRTLIEVERILDDDDYSGNRDGTFDLTNCNEHRNSRNNDLFMNIGKQ